MGLWAAANTATRRSWPPSATASRSRVACQAKLSTVPASSPARQPPVPPQPQSDDKDTLPGGAPLMGQSTLAEVQSIVARKVAKTPHRSQQRCTLVHRHAIQRLTGTASALSLSEPLLPAVRTAGRQGDWEGLRLRARRLLGEVQGHQLLAACIGHQQCLAVGRPGSPAQWLRRSLSKVDSLLENPIVSPTAGATTADSAKGKINL